MREGSLPTRTHAHVRLAPALVAGALVFISCAPGAHVSPAASSSDAPSTRSATPTGARPGTDALHYTISVDDDVSLLHVTVCGDGALPTALFPGDRRAGPYVTEARLVDGASERSLVVRDGRITVGADAEGCVHYRVDALRAAWTEATPNVADRVARDLVLCPDLFLWRGARAPLTTGSARFIVPAGVRVSTPWPLDGDQFALPASTFRLYGRVIIGRGFTPVQVDVTGGRLDVAVLSGPLAPDAPVVHEFLALAGEAVSLAWGRFPRSRVQVTVTPVPARNVPFGMVIRGGGPGVHLLVGVHGSARDLASDWVTVHELSHLLTPTLDPDDAWFGEGIATWYQSVLRARAGLISDDEAWSSLLTGFARGARANDGHTLAESSKRMRRERNYTRVYWGGTAFAMRADLALRARSLHSLDDAVRALESCCFHTDRMYTSRETVIEMERALGVDFLLPLHDEIASSAGFPDVASSLTALGVRLADDKIVYDGGPEARALRAAILRRSPAHDDSAATLRVRETR
jgi:hypothetical protein